MKTGSLKFFLEFQRKKNSWVAEFKGTKYTIQGNVLYVEEKNWVRSQKFPRVSEAKLFALRHAQSKMGVES
jgi:hypothetical protein